MAWSPYNLVQNKEHLDHSYLIQCLLRMLGGGHLVALGRPSRPAALTTLSPPSKICRRFSGLNNIWPQEPSQGLVLAVSSPAAPDKPRVSGCCVCRQLWLLQSLWVEAWLQLAACPWRVSSTEHRGPHCPTSGLTHTHKVSATPKQWHR